MPMHKLFFEFIICKITIIIIIIIIKFVFAGKTRSITICKEMNQNFLDPFFFGSKKLKITFFKETSFLKNIS
jgi:hypothetical protein